MNSSNYAGLAWPAVFVVVTGIYGYWAVQRELVSSRPSTAGVQGVPDPVPPPGIRSFHSRMWQDPLSASYEHYRSLPKEQRQEEANGATVLDVDLPEELVKATAKAGYERWMSPTPSADSTPPEDHNALEHSQQRAQDRAMQHFFRNLVAKDLATVCLPVFLPGGPYAEDKEERTRIRYAVVTALAEAGYHLKLNRRMSYVTPRVFVRVMWGWQDRELVVPVKLYRFDESETTLKTKGQPKPVAANLDETTSGEEDGKLPRGIQILVLWINESELGERPLLTTHRILNQLFATVAASDQGKLKVSLVGPMSSDSLETMVDKARALQNESVGPPSIETKDFQHWFLSRYAKSQDDDANGEVERHAAHPSITGTVEPMKGFMPLLAGQAQGDTAAFDTPELFSPRATKAGLDGFPDEHIIRLHRCIGTDEVLAKSVYDELKLRGVFPGHVVLITEHDTGYGRAIPETYEKAFLAAYLDEKRRQSARKQFQEDIQFHTFAILRGIDGKLPGDDGTDGGSSKRSNSASGTNLPEVIERRPEGRTQYDYMRRLAQRIEQQPEVHAIGILGSDVYDKLLVLRALKPQFPDCVFFTTDLDAIYSHSTERQHTRNLLIASHYSLSLHKDLQTRTAPFRDSYQTATFLATRLAVESARRQFGHEIRGTWSKMYDQGRTDATAAELIQPLMMVVGKDRVHPLPPSPDLIGSAFALHPTPVQSGRASHYLYVLTVAVLIAAICWLCLNRDRIIGSPLRKELRNSTVRYSLMILLATGLLLACVFFVRGRLSPEEAPFLGGYSTWPTKFLYSLIGIASVATCAYLIHHWCRKLDSISEYNDLIGERSARCFQAEHTVKIGLLGLVMIYIAGLFTYPISSHHFWLPGSLALLSLAGIWIYWTKQVTKGVAVVGGCDDSPPPRNVILGSDLRCCVGVALLCMVGVALLALIASWERSNTAHNRWFPAHLSRGIFSREGDYIANLFAFGTVGLLLTSLLYLHLWCREFARYVLKKPEDEDDAQLDNEKMRREFGEVGEGTDLIAEAKNERDRLWTIGQLSGVTGRFGPALLGLLFLLVIGFHPNFSPVAMPTSLLVIATLFVVMFVVSTLSIRWHFQRERQRVLARLERKTLKYHANQLARSESETSGSPPPAKRTSTDVPLEDRVDELMEIVRPYGEEAPAAATLATAVLQQKKAASGPDVDRAVEARRDQIALLSDGVFQSWNQSPMGWILGGGATIALVDLWIRAWTIGI